MNDSRKFIERATSTIKKDQNSDSKIVEMQFDNIGDARGAATFLTKSGISSPDEVYLATTPPTIQVGTLDGIEKLRNAVNNNPDEYPKTKELLENAFGKASEKNAKNGNSDEATAAEYYKKKWGESVGSASERGDDKNSFSR